MPLGWKLGKFFFSSKVLTELSDDLLITLSREHSSKTNFLSQRELVEEMKNKGIVQSRTLEQVLVELDRKFFIEDPNQAYLNKPFRIH